MKAKDSIYLKLKEIVEKSGNDVTYKDFISFDLLGVHYSYTPGTIRNNFSVLRREGKIELVCRSPIAFYTLAGLKYEKGMTYRYRGVQNKIVDFYIKVFKIHGLNDPAIHDIRLKFNIPDIHSILPSIKSNLITNIDKISNKDITLKDIPLKDIIVKTTVHHSNNVTVMIACSENPIPFNSMGLSTLTSALTRVEERLQRELDTYYQNKLDETNEYDCNNGLFKVPHHMSWTVAMWHFGQDSSLGLSGKTFDINWNEVHELYHIYLKKRKKQQ
ncbi:hypothetical protein [Candidatus Nitrosocosmicus hydrocola]|uniref:hypothetical protein n=1 Tax=Candidatus Nitrosocosmicus hydrocola TaxID=1826872 RepID=UPI0011E5C685|nr:hypothetical protein [Candidatus Nitrosocosmicus hydrocola]